MLPVFPAAIFTALGKFHTIVNFLNEFIQGDCKGASTFNALFLTDYKHEITSFLFGAHSDGHIVYRKGWGAILYRKGGTPKWPIFDLFRKSS